MPKRGRTSSGKPPRKRRLLNEGRASVQRDANGCLQQKKGGGTIELPDVDWSKHELPPFQSNFYREHSKVARLTEPQVMALRAKMGITVAEHGSVFENARGWVSGGVPAPVKGFKRSSLPRSHVEALFAAGYRAPTPIQSQSWPIVLSGKNMVGLAQTGSGKTAAFLMPLMVHACAQPCAVATKDGDTGPVALVLVPTRELAIQIRDEAQKLMPNPLRPRLRVSLLYGGASKAPQIRSLQRGAEIVVATPGRLLDLVNRQVFHLRRVSLLVLDEADRMLDMGFMPDVRTAIGQTRPDRQTIMFSATWSDSVQELAREFLGRNFAQINIGSLQPRANHRIRQIVEIVPDDGAAKAAALLRILREEANVLPVEGSAAGETSKRGAASAAAERERVLVFCSRKKSCAEVADSLWRAGYSVDCIHGDKAQWERKQALEKFKDGSVPILVATDVAARGLDVKALRYVVNMSMPMHDEDYIHRIGRTGRAGRHGTAFTLFSAWDKHKARGLVQVLEEADQTVPPQLREWARDCLSKAEKKAARRGKAGKGKGERRPMTARDYEIARDHGRPRGRD